VGLVKVGQEEVEQSGILVGLRCLSMYMVLLCISIKIHQLWNSRLANYLLSYVYVNYLIMFHFPCDRHFAQRLSRSVSLSNSMTPQPYSGGSENSKSTKERVPGVPAKITILAYEASKARTLGHSSEGRATGKEN